MIQLSFWGYFILSFCVLTILLCTFALIYSIFGYFKYGNDDYNWIIPTKEDVKNAINQWREGT